MSEFNTIVGDGKYKIIFETDDKNEYQQVQAILRLIISSKNIKAIPIEWIVKFADNVWWDDKAVIENMLERWEKENEIN